MWGHAVQMWGHAVQMWEHAVDMGTCSSCFMLDKMARFIQTKYVYTLHPDNGHVL